MSFDILVVGAGPAGLSSAFSAAKAGARVAVFEKSKEIGYPIHTSGGSWIDELKKLDIPKRFMHPIKEGYFLSPNEQAVFKYEKPVSCILDIRGLYQYLAEIASAKGAEIFVNSSVFRPYFQDDRLAGLWVRRIGRKELFKAPLIIDASGTASFLPRKLGLAEGFKRVGLGAEYDLFAPKWPQERVALLFGNQVAPSGYGWVFPHRNNRIRLGVGIISPDSKEDPKKYLENLLTNPQIFADEFDQVSRLEYHSGVIPSEIYFPETVFDNLLIVGDAGGLISTLLGEGIRFAIDIGRLAGEVAGEAALKQRHDARFLKKYEKRWKKKYKRIFQIGSFINNRLAKYTDEMWDNKIRALASVNASLVPSLLKADFSFKLLIQMARGNPRLLSKSLYFSLQSILKNA